MNLNSFPFMVKKILLFIFFFFCLSISAQSDIYKKKIDSLERILPSIKTDTSKVKAFLQISEFYKGLENASDAMVYSEKAVALSTKANWEKGLVLSYRSLAASYEYKTDFKNELIYYNKAINLAKEMKDEYLVAGVYRNLALADKNTDLAVVLGYFDKAISIFKKLGYTDEYLDALMQKGGVYSLKGMNYEAADCFREVRDVAEKKDRISPFMSASKYLADIYRKRSENDKALDIYLSLLKKAEANKVFNGYTADIYSAVASMYSDKKEYKKAIDYHTKALNIHKQYDDFYSRVASLGYISMQYRLLGDKLNEKKYMDEAHAFNLKNPYKLSQMYGYVFFGRVEYANGNYNEALKNHLASLTIGEELGVKEQTALAYGNVGATYYELAKADGADENLLLGKSITYLEKGVEANKEMRNLDRISGFLFYLYEAYSLKGDYKNAFNAHKEYILYRDSINNIEKNDTFLAREKEYEYGKKETLLKTEQKLSLEKEKTLRNMSLGGIGVLVIVAGVAGVGYVRKRKDNKIIEKEKKRSDDLLLNILPYEVAEELKEKGEANAKYYEKVSIIFTDFEGFTKLSEKMSPTELIDQLNYCFKAFDNIITKYNIEKIKTIGDAYMAVSGLPNADPDHAINAVKAAIEIRDFIENYKQERKREGKIFFEMRIGINSGEVVAGIIGVKKFAYDVWGDAVNVAARMETNGIVGKINISEATYGLVKDDIAAEYRGEIEVKGKGVVKMYFAEPKNSKVMEFEKVKDFILTKLDKELPKSLYYHNIEHIIDVYDAVNRHIETAIVLEEDGVLLKTAALFHDSGFIIRAEGHEALSCDFARQYLPGFNYNDTQISKICGMIMATKIPQSPQNSLEEIMADADLDYLGRSDFFEISDKLYKELYESGIVQSEEQWNRIQVKFFEEHNYFTETAKELRQAKKLENLELIKLKLSGSTI